MLALIIGGAMLTAARQVQAAVGRQAVAAETTEEPESQEAMATKEDRAMLEQSVAAVREEGMLQQPPDDSDDSRLAELAREEPRIFAQQIRRMIEGEVSENTEL